MSEPIRSIAVIAPSGPVPKDRLAAGVGILRAMGRTVELFFDPAQARSERFLAAPDPQRAAELMAAGARGADAILAARGGYGGFRLIEALPPAPPGPPATLIGFSDVTALLLSLSRRWAWRGVHGPNLTTLGDLDRPSLAAFEAFLDAPGVPVRFEGLEPLHPGRAEGRLIGGNLAVLCSLLGTPEEPDLSGGVLFLEDVGEAPYRLDRLLRQLAASRTFSGLRGVAVGDLGEGMDDAIRRTLASLGARLGVPVLAGLPLGHGAANRPLILGSSAVLDADLGVLATGRPDEARRPSEVLETASKTV